MAKCNLCRLAPGNSDLPNQYWSGIAGAKNEVLEREKKAGRIEKSRSKQLARLSKDRSRTRLLGRAVKAEKTTESVIQSTINSGRKFSDGDHLLAGAITLDTKLQTARQHPKVDLAELDKVGEDSKRAGTLFGALVIRNANNVGVVVMKEADFAMLVDQWRNKSNVEQE